VQTTEPVGLIGTGFLGTALAERLLADGYRVFVSDRIPAKAEPLLARGAFLRPAR
jgi:3-hydroxyisobutyrate dehydrogenase-like beta-hydroxyacid dehydrogenase